VGPYALAAGAGPAGRLANAARGEPHAVAAGAIANARPVADSGRRAQRAGSRPGVPRRRRLVRLGQGITEQLGHRNLLEETNLYGSGSGATSGVPLVTSAVRSMSRQIT
jgi:hypothetical protein